MTVTEVRTPKLLREGCDSCGTPEDLEWVAERKGEHQLCAECLRKIRRCPERVTVNLRCEWCFGSGCHKCTHGRRSVIFASPEDERESRYRDVFEDRWLKDELERSEGYWPDFGGAA